MKKRQNTDGGVPEWIVTYGDMMSLLLTFFILLAAFSEIKQPDKVQDVIKAIRERFGMIEGGGDAPVDAKTLQSVLEMLEETALYKEKIKKQSNADDPGITGRQTTVTRVREGLQFTVGGLLTFEPGRADLKPQAKEELAKIANVIRGQNNKVEIRGHASGTDATADSPYQSLWDLSYARAKAVMEFMTAPAQGIDVRRIRLIGCGAEEPLAARVYEPSQQSVNRRVELIVTETLIQDFQAEQAAQPDRPALSAATPILR
jgi:chemotaxis protein MotB